MRRRPLSGGKQCRMPSEQAVGRQRLVVAPDRVQHHFHAALDIMVRGTREGGGAPEAPSDRRANLFEIERFSFDRPRFHDIRRERVQSRLSPEVEAERLRATLKTADPMANVGKPCAQGGTIPNQIRPLLELVYPGRHIRRNFCGEYACIYRMRKDVSWSRLRSRICGSSNEAA